MTEFWIWVVVALVVGAAALWWLLMVCVWIAGAYMVNKGGMKRKGGK